MNKKGFSKRIIKLLLNSFKDRKLFTISIDDVRSLLFLVDDGLFQGTVNAPKLFNIYNSDTLRLFKLNSDGPVKAIAFADHLIVYETGRSPKEIQPRLEKTLNKINAHYK